MIFAFVFGLCALACEPSTDAIAYLQGEPDCLEWVNVGPPETAVLELTNRCSTALSLRTEPFPADEPCSDCTLDLTLEVDATAQVTLHPPPAFIGRTPCLLTWADGSTEELTAHVYGYERILCNRGIGSELSPKGCTTAAVLPGLRALWRR